MTRQTAVESPPVNVYESNDQLTVAIPIPGAHHDTVTVALEGSRLTVDAGTSHRVIDLPKAVRASGAKAMLTHGILTISLPIGREEPAARIRIPVTEPPVHQGQPH